MNTAEQPRIEKGGKIIDSVDSWFNLAPPKEGARQWQDGRSAKELAKAWFPVPGHASVPPEVSQLLDSHVDLAGFVVAVGSPEVQIKLDDYRGETRNADMVLQATKGSDRLVVTIEAKADESFDATIEEKIKSTPQSSNIPKRIDHLCRGLFGATPSEMPALLPLRYQLLHAVAATLIVARQLNAKKALFVVHEFRTTRTTEERLLRNQSDLERFVKVLSRGATAKVPAGNVVGPLSTPGGEHVPAGVDLYLGKAQRDATSTV